MASENSILHPDITIYQSKLVKKKPPTESYSENRLLNLWYKFFSKNFIYKITTKCLKTCSSEGWNYISTGPT